MITGSSNFSESGLIANREFNVQLKNSQDVQFALEKFELLWQEAVDISDYYIDTVNSKTYLNDEIKPYQLYLKFLYEYFKEDLGINEDLFYKNNPNSWLNVFYDSKIAAEFESVGKLDKIFLETIFLVTNADTFTYSRYTPLLFLVEFIIAAKLFEAQSETKRENILPDYHSLLGLNKKALEFNLVEDEVQGSTSGKGRDNALRILKMLKSKEMRKYHGFTDMDEQYIKAVIKLLEEGALPKSTTKRIFGEIKSEANPLKILGHIKRNLPDEFFQENYATNDQAKFSRNEVILSECFIR